jgi:carbonic anhydrase/acetyltransferase-like protein (isoleucine patch superfamily)
MIIEHQGQRPSIDPTARIAPTAVICGDVAIGANTSVGFGAVLVAESGAVAIGRDCVIMDTAVIRGVRGNPVTIGDHVLVGPRAYLSGCSVADDAFLATGATVFNGARIGRRAEVRINGLVHLRSVLPDDATVPINWVAVGDPARILPPDRHDAIWAVQKPLNFPGYVFGVERPRDGQSIMPEVMPRYAAFLARAHGADRQVEL